MAAADAGGAGVGGDDAVEMGEEGSQFSKGASGPEDRAFKTIRDSLRLLLIQTLQEQSVLLRDAAGVVSPVLQNGRETTV